MIPTTTTIHQLSTPPPIIYPPNHHHHLSAINCLCHHYLSTTFLISLPVIPFYHRNHSSINLTTTSIHSLSSLPCHPPLNMKHHCHRSMGGGHPWRNRTMRTCPTTWLQRRCWRRSVWGTTLSSPRSSRYLPARAPDGLFSWLFVNMPNINNKTMNV